jgi:hypothetical protein
MAMWENQVEKEYHGKPVQKCLYLGKALSLKNS